jgi:hypothetical protein
MGIAYTADAMCDRCGEREVKEGPDWRDMEYIDRKFEGWGRMNHPISYESLELCPDCIASLEQWMKEGRDE